MSSSGDQRRAWVPRVGAHGRVCGLIAVIALTSVTLWWTQLRGRAPASDELDLSWLVVLTGFIVVEAFVVHLHFRTESGSFSLLEVPLVFGLLFAPPDMVWLAMVIGSAISLSMIRRMPLLKVVFNVANLSLHVAVAWLALSLTLNEHAALSALGWVSIAGAMTLAAVVEVTLIACVISLSEARFQFDRIGNMMAFGAVVALANTLQATIAALVIVENPYSLILLAGSTAILFIAYRAYVSERDNRERVEFLYNSSKSLAEAGEISGAISGLLEEAVSMFRASTAELHLFPVADTDGQPTHYLHAAGRTEAEVLDPEMEETIADYARLCKQPRRGTASDPDAPLAALLRRRGHRDAMVGALQSDTRVIGLLTVADRLGNVTSFTDEDLSLFDKLVQQSSVALENDQLEQALVQLRLLEQELAHQARYDALTGLANRSMFESVLSQRLTGVDASELAVLYIDLDDFKSVNDTLGHAAGDAVLAEVGRRIADVVRPSDVAARLGGDEFAVVLAASDDPAAVAHRIIGRLSAPVVLGGEEARIGASVGLARALAEDVGTSGERLLGDADLAMYTAKDRGKGSVVEFNQGLQADAAKQQSLQSDIRRAITDSEFEVRYQPIIEMCTETVVGAEALVRWRHPSGRQMLPREFLAEAETSGLVTAIDQAVRRQVLRDLATLLPVGGDRYFTSLNLSPRDIRHHGLVDEFAADVLEADVPAASLVVEVTEAVFLRDVDAASAVLVELQSFGVRVALDDFGIGYSSLNHLRTLPIDLLKIAQPFVQDLSAGNDTRGFVRAIVELSHTLGFEVVAEGIEDEQVAGLLTRLGADYGQGYYYARPMPLHDLTALLEEHAGARRATRA